ncbi:MAG: right-handed parallel beta-helix repeat-containing protein [Clostridia bacterium]|nr:right-handed parallel beta-helix repeat-containing protein [Clostridia bacterium]
MKTLKNSSGYDASIKYFGGAEKQAKEMRDAILNSPNTEDIYEIKGTKYYIKKDMSVDSIPEDLQPGDAVLFERGGLWRVQCKEKLIIPEGVIFGAFGTGEKPKFYGSAYNYANNSLWEKHTENIWKKHMPSRNAGIVVFDEKYALGVKQWALEDVKQNYDFYFDGPTDMFFMYYDGDLEKDFSSIEIGQRGDIITMNSNTVLDNVCIRYGASHGVKMEHNVQNVAVTNCEIGFIGGSMQFDQVRFGNGVELCLGAKNAVIKNNWVYECYDAGLTFQSWRSGKDTYYEGIDMSENLIELCYYGIEFFTTCFETSGLRSGYKDMKMCDNIIRFSGYTWCHEQRPDKWMLSHIRGGQWAWVPECENFKITGNIFDTARQYMIHWWWHGVDKNFIHPEPHVGLTVENNTYYQSLSNDKRCMLYHTNIPVEAQNYDELVAAVKLFDKNPKEIILLD